MFKTNTSWQMKVEEPKTRNNVRKDTLKQEMKGKTKRGEWDEKQAIFRVKCFTEVKWKYLLSISPSSPFSSTSSCSQGLGWSRIPMCRSESPLLPATQFLELIPRHAGQRRRRRR